MTPGTHKHTDARTTAAARDAADLEVKGLLGGLTGRNTDTAAPVVLSGRCPPRPRGCGYLLTSPSHAISH